MVWVIPDINMVKKYVVKIARLVPFFIVIATFPFFFFGGPTSASTKLFGVLWDSGHVIFFTALVFSLRKKINLNNWRIALLISLIVFVAGGLIEIIQAYIGRDGNWNDLLRDLMGTWLGLFWAQQPSIWVWCGRIVSFALLLPNLGKILFEVWFQLYAIQQFPLLAGFETVTEVRGYRDGCERSAEFHTQGNYSLKVHLTTSLYSVVNFDRIMRDWRGFKQLGVDIYNPDPTALTLTIRIHDELYTSTGWRNTDRFTRHFIVKPGWNYLVFPINEIQHAPADRSMDMAKIARVTIHSTRLAEPRVIYMDNLRLE